MGIVLMNGMFGVLYLVVLSVLVPDAAAATPWETCSSTKSISWSKRVTACREIVRREKDPKKLATAHFHIAENLARSYDAFITIGSEQPCNPDKGLWSESRDRLCMYIDPLEGLGLSPAEKEADCHRFAARNVTEPTTRNLDVVVAEYRKVLRYDPEHRDARLAIERGGRMCLPAGDREKFTELIKAAQQSMVAKDYAGARSKLDELVGMSGQFAAQDAAFRGNALVMRGLATAALGETAHALQDLDRAVEIAPSEQSYYRRALLRLSTGDAFGAADDLNAAIQAGSSPVLFATRAELFFSRHAFEAALPDLGRLIAEESTPAHRLKSAAFLSRALVLHQLGNVEGAIADYRAVFSMLPGSDPQTRSRVQEIVAGLKRIGIYKGNGEVFDSELESALTQCVAAPQCRFYPKTGAGWSRLEMSAIFPPPPPGWTADKMVVDYLDSSSDELAESIGLSGLMPVTVRVRVVRTYRHGESSITLSTDTEDFKTASIIDVLHKDANARRNLMASGLEPWTIRDYNGMRVTDPVAGEGYVFTVNTGGVVTLECGAATCPIDLQSLAARFRFAELERFFSDRHSKSD